MRLFQVSGSDPSNTKAIEVPALAGCLNSNDVFLLKSQTGIYLWCGKVCGHTACRRMCLCECGHFDGFVRDYVCDCEFLCLGIVCECECYSMPVCTNSSARVCMPE